MIILLQETFSFYIICRVITHSAPSVLVKIRLVYSLFRVGYMLYTSPRLIIF